MNGSLVIRARWIVLLGLVIAGLIVSMAVTVTAATPDYAPQDLPACQVEDGSGTTPKPCYWDGGSNDQGRHYVVNEDGSTTYVTE